VTHWHITFGAYGARLHGDERPTVDRAHNVYGTPFLGPDRDRNAREHALCAGEPVRLTGAQRAFIEHVMPSLCARGGWWFLTCAAGPDHVHILLDADPRIHGKRIHPLLKRWLTQALDERWTCPKRPDGQSWWGEGGSNKAVKDEAYLRNALAYINQQRTTPPPIP
jgi:REP element-mobilizing transposase RayT